MAISSSAPPRDPAGAPPVASGPRFAHLDAMRALAALAVVGFHAFAISGFSGTAALGAVTSRLDLGVTVFFLLSGFLLYRPYVAVRLEGRAPMPLRRFYGRRLLRIVPAYWLALTVLALGPGVGGGVLSVPGGLRYYLFAQNLSADTVVQGIGPAWTLCVELGFYAVLPLYAVLAARGLAHRPDRTRARDELLLLALLGSVSVGLRALLPSVLSPSQGIVFVSVLPAFLLWFGLGMGLAVISATGAAPRLRAAIGRHDLACWAGAAALLAVAAWGIDAPRGFGDTPPRFTLVAEHVLYGGIALLLLAPATITPDGGGPVRALLSWRPLALLGLISFGIYLYHLPLLLWFLRRGTANELPFGPTVGLFILSVGASIICALVSYRLLERPLLERKRPR